MHKRCGWGHTYFFIVLVGVLAYPVHAEALESVYNETWESGQGDWDVSNGVWGVGDPSEGPSSCYAGARCAGSVLNGNYPTDTDSRLISPSIDLPSVAGMQTVVLRFWQWFSYHAGDSGVVQISGFDAQNGWSAFSNASDSIVDYSGGWSRIDVDLTEYAGKKVRIGFLHVAKNVLNGVDESAGWFIDDVSVQKFLPAFDGGFEGAFLGDIEGGWSDWSASRGVWQVGTPSNGPDTCYVGNQCMGTRQDSVYPSDTDTRLVSVAMTLPSVTGKEQVRMRFWQWFSYHAGDSGVVQVSEFDTQTGWSAFTNASDSIVDYSAGWSRIDVDLTEYAGKEVRIGFLHVAKNVLNGVDESAGWFIDDVSVRKFLPAFDGGFEGAFLGDIEGGWSDWSASRGVWQVGTPSNGPDTCFVGNQCMGTRQDSIYPSDTDTRLVSVAMNLPSVTGEEQVRMRFWQWFSYHAGDSGVVQVSEYDAQSGWSAFSNASDSIVDYSAGWSRIDVDLTEYAGKKVRIGFLHVAKNVLNGVDESAGWFIDEISMVKKQPDFFIHPDSGIEYGDFEGASEGDVSGGWADWSASRGVWQVGAASLAPDKCHSGKLCVGTVLDVNYPSDTDSRLVSPPIVMPADAPAVALRMRFWHWHSYHSGDSAVVQISVFDESTGWSAWESLADGGPFVGLSSGWTRKSIDLLLYAGKKIRIGFLHSAANVLSGVDESSGWFIDNIKLPGVFLRPCEGDFDNDGDVDNSNTAIFSANFGRTNCSLDVFCEADFSGDGDVDNSDVFIFSQDFGDTMCFDN